MQLLKRLPLWGVYALLAYMPFSLFISRWLSLYTGGLGQWDAAKDVLTLILLLVAVGLALKKKLLQDKFIFTVFIVSGFYLGLHLLFIAINENLDTRSAIVATLYNGRILAYFFIGLIALRVYGREILPTVLKIVLIASTITCLFAIVQYIAPSDLMTHFGYSVERGAKPSFFIDDKPDFPRVMSTVRDPNSYGAYLIVPLVLSWIYLLKSDKNKKLRLSALGMVLLHGWVLFLTFSRGAWLGALLALSLATLHMHRAKLQELFKRFWPVVAVSFLLAVGLALQFRNHYVFQNVFLHSDQKTVLDDPNELRVQLQTDTAKAVIEQPQGHGPGTAGLPSIGNPKGTLLPENYFLQIAYEVGLLGLFAFIFILSLAFARLQKTTSSDMRTTLLTSFWAYIFISMLIHLWSNEAVALQWWLLAGLLAGTTLAPNQSAKRRPSSVR